MLSWTRPRSLTTGKGGGGLQNGRGRNCFSHDEWGGGGGNTFLGRFYAGALCFSHTEAKLR